MKARKIKPEFWRDATLAAVPRDRRLLFIGLWNLADDHGYLEDSATLVRGSLFAADWDVDDSDVAGWLDGLVARGPVVRLRDGRGVPLLRIPSLTRHQGIKVPRPSQFAVPEAAQPADRPTAKDGALPDMPDALRARVAPVAGLLVEVIEGNGARSPLPVLLRGVAMALLDYPRRDHLEIAREYRAWQLGGGARAPHRDAVKGYRNQLKMGQDVAAVATRSGAGREREKTLAEIQADMGLT